MQDTASPVLAKATADAHPSLAFADADGAKRWSKSLLISGVTPLYEVIHGQLRALSRADFTPRERATIAEVMRDQVAHLHTELARRYAGKPQPAADREVEATEQALALWQLLWEQYSACLKPLLEGDVELQGVKAKLLQRGLYVGKHGRDRAAANGDGGNRAERDQGIQERGRRCRRKEVAPFGGIAG